MNNAPASVYSQRRGWWILRYRWSRLTLHGNSLLLPLGPFWVAQPQVCNGTKKGITAKPSSVQLDAENENRDNKFSLASYTHPKKSLTKTFILVWSGPSISSTSKICWLSLRAFTFLWIGLSISVTSLKLADCLCFWYFLGFDFLTSWHNLVRQHECKSGSDWFMVISYFPSVTFLEFQGRNSVSLT